MPFDGFEFILTNDPEFLDAAVVPLEGYGRAERNDGSIGRSVLNLGRTEALVPIAKIARGALDRIPIARALRFRKPVLQPFDLGLDKGQPFGRDEIAVLGNELLRKLLHGVGFFDECSAHHSNIGALGGRHQNATTPGNVGN